MLVTPPVARVRDHDESLRTRGVTVQVPPPTHVNVLRGHFGWFDGVASFLPARIIADFVRTNLCGRILEAAQDRVETGGDGSVPIPGRVLVAPGGGRIGVAQAGHQLPLGGARPGGEGSGYVTKIVKVEIVPADFVTGATPMLVEGGGGEETAVLGGELWRVRVVVEA